MLLIDLMHVVCAYVVVSFSVLLGIWTDHRRHCRLHCTSAEDCD